MELHRVSDPSACSLDESGVMGHTFTMCLKVLELTKVISGGALAQSVELLYQVFSCHGVSLAGK